MNRPSASRLRILSLLLLALVTSGPAFAVEPVLKELRPPGGQRGKSFILKVAGEGLTPDSEVMTTIPGSVSRLAPPKDLASPDTELSFIVQIPENAPVGLYPFRLRTQTGLSNVLIFSVGDLPEVSEKEPNDSIEQAQPIAVPVTVNGSLTAADQDFYRLSVKARERLVMEVEARRMASAIDPVIEVLDASGHRIAFNDDAPGLGVDARVDVTFPKAGNYYVVVHDSKYSDHPENFYRLKVGAFQYADGIFPLGWQRGKSADVTFLGGNLPRPVKVRLSLDLPPEVQTIPVYLPGPRPVGTLPFEFQVSDFREVLAPEGRAPSELEANTVVNGCLRKSGQVDRFKLKVSPGEKWLFTLSAALVGTSQLFGELKVYDSRGHRLRAKDVSNGADPELSFAVPERVEEVMLEVGDLRGSGGPTYGYRLLAIRGSGDFDLQVLTPYANLPAGGAAAVKVVAVRHGYEGPIELSIPNLPGGLEATGGHIPGELTDYSGIRRQSNFGYLTLTSKPEMEARTFRLLIWGQGGPKDQPIRRLAQGSGLVLIVPGEFPEEDPQGDPLPPKPFIAPWLGMNLPVAVTNPLPVALEIATRYNHLVQGMELPIEWKLVKRDPSIVPLTVGGLPVPFNKDINYHRTDDSKIGDTGSISLRSTVDAPLITLDAVLSAKVRINNKEETVTSPAIAVQVVRGYSIALARERVDLKRGGKVEMAGTIRREPSFPGTVKITVGDPPNKVTCSAAEVPTGVSEFHLICEAAAGAREGDFEVHLVSSATVPGYTANREFTIPLVLSHIVVTGLEPTRGSG